MHCKMNYCRNYLYIQILCTKNKSFKTSKHLKCMHEVEQSYVKKKFWAFKMCNVVE